jgi:hypothetical protein
VVVRKKERKKKESKDKGPEHGLLEENENISSTQNPTLQVKEKRQ